MKIMQLMVGQMQVFAYVVGCEKTGEAVVIDPGGYEERIADRAGKADLKITKIVNTHGHPDHTCGNFRMKELTDAPIIVHSAEAPHLTNPHNVEFSKMLGSRPTPPADQTVDHGDVIAAGQEVKLKVLHTPGHSPGCICLNTEGHVFTGDTLFVGAVGRTDLPGSSWPQMLNSIKSHILTLPGDTVVWPGHHYGHSPQSTVRKEQLENSFIQ